MITALVLLLGTELVSVAPPSANHSEQLKAIRTEELRERRAQLQAQQAQYALQVAQAKHAMAQLQHAPVAANPLATLQWQGLIETADKALAVVVWQQQLLQLPLAFEHPSGLYLWREDDAVYARYDGQQKMLSRLGELR
ncbi:hypothetical protein [Pseudidiomarina taiwanensis]|uniref:Uncharacterized protein n=1 Tax=Pseudidiomarina taiwanensis TaxID=337250 RepID=A0A432ZJW7_9GAMM|nr:hypothetical protein [Pseudidiomarina taiwanensis]RUO78261.1 hypothetical protein CWI83_04305 [Pseudidiomarina taiwanensis]